MSVDITYFYLDFFDLLYLTQVYIVQQLYLNFD